MITSRSSNLITEILSFLSRRETQMMIKKAQQAEEGKRKEFSFSLEIAMIFPKKSIMLTKKVMCNDKNV